MKKIIEIEKAYEWQTDRDYSLSIMEKRDYYLAGDVVGLREEDISILIEVLKKIENEIENKRSIENRMKMEVYRK